MFASKKRMNGKQCLLQGEAVIIQPKTAKSLFIFFFFFLFF